MDHTASPDQSIQQPWFACMERVIVAIGPLAVALMVVPVAFFPVANVRFALPTALRPIR
jgi:hypothetical protein